MGVEGLTLTEYVMNANSPAVAQMFSNLTGAVQAGEISPVEFASRIEQISGRTVSIHRSVSGKVIGYTLDNAVSSGALNPINSNASTLTRGTISMPVSTEINTAGKAAASRLSGVGSKIITGASKVAVPLTLASIGITLGKTIDETLYKANPDFWNSIGAESLNPQTWSSIAGGDGTLGGSFINALFGINPNTGETQAYIDADAMSYLAYVMQNAGVFSAGGIEPVPFERGTTLHPTDFITGNVQALAQTYLGQSIDPTYDAILDCDGILGYTTRGVLIVIYGSTGSWSTYPNGKPTHVSITDPIEVRYVTDGVGTIDSNLIRFLRNEDDEMRPAAFVEYDPDNQYVNRGSSSAYSITSITNGGTTGTMQVLVAKQGQAITGIGTQDGATTPNFEGLAENEYLPYLQQQYPDMFNNAINYPVLQDDGTVKNHTYVPITLPDTSNTTSTQPISGGQTQAQPSIDPSTATDTMTELLTKLLQQPLTQPISDNPNPPTNPTETGEGSSPVPVPPVGSASSLWKIYHPTQAEVNSFGAWLWSPSFIDQIQKIFNNPMESIIGLHKVYVTPIDAGNSTIHVGYLDSGVSSAYIEQQYVDVDCGSVSLIEQFGNALDYIATSVKLYLPFVGIVPLNVNEVMRSSINVSYGVDVLTGACLARVKISRDGNDGILYQYAGNCAVQYPVSSGSYMGIVSSILGIAGSVAATVATGGGAAPLAIGAASAAMGAHTSVQNSGNFSGNAGAMGGKIPYLIIERSQSKLAPNFAGFEGYPANDNVKIGQCSGFVRGRVSHIEGISATDTELDEIAKNIANGVLV